MDELIHILKTAGPIMVPFIKTVTIYFIVFPSEPKGEIWTTLLKCAPIVCLMFFILLYGFNFITEQKYSKQILYGLVFSCAGDALLNCGLFPHGMGAFALAQGFYISAFGFRPLKLWIGISLYIIGILFISLIYNTLDDVIVVGLPIYALLLTTMCWRSIARAIHKTNFINILCGIGSVLFVISDGFIAIDKFYTKIPNARIYVMTTYYAAQFAITLSIVNSRKISEIISSEKLTELNTFENTGVGIENSKTK